VSTLDLDSVGDGLEDPPLAGQGLDDGVDGQSRTHPTGEVVDFVDQREQPLVGLCGVQRERHAVADRLAERVGQSPFVGGRVRRPRERAVEVALEVALSLGNGLLVRDDEPYRSSHRGPFVEELFDGVDSGGFVTVDPADDCGLGVTPAQGLDSHSVSRLFGRVLTVSKPAGGRPNRPIVHLLSHTAGCTHVADFAIPGWRISSDSYSRQY